jgi:hypothetical protein
MPDRPITAALLAVATILAGILACLVLALALHLPLTRAATPHPDHRRGHHRAGQPRPRRVHPDPRRPTPHDHARRPGAAMSALGAPILAGLLPPRGALVGIAALVALAVLDRIPLRAYQPRADRYRIPRHRPPRHAPTVTLTRPDPHPAPPPGRAIKQRLPSSPAITPRTDTREGR